ncbi:MAG: hypothetical protein EAZ97_00235, partial [Bacteroidetes bacterium]
MAKRKKESAEKKEWKEGELIKTFKLKRIKEYQTPLMKEWLDISTPPVFDVVEQGIFDRKLGEALRSLEGWSEEDLKMKFITHILDLGHLNDEGEIVGYFDKMLSATVEGIKLTVKSDFMIAKGILNVHENPYFHFQEYKPQLNPSGEPMAQLLEAFLIGNSKNEIPKPLYGVEIIGKQWTFVIMENKDYCISK